MVLGHSRFIFARFVMQQDFRTLLRCHMKTAVTRENGRVHGTTQKGIEAPSSTPTGISVLSTAPGAPGRVLSDASR